MALTLSRWIAAFCAGALLIVPIMVDRVASPYQIEWGGDTGSQLAQRVERERSRLDRLISMRVVEQRTQQRMDSLLERSRSETVVDGQSIVLVAPALAKYRRAIDSIAWQIRAATPADRAIVPTIVAFVHRGTTRGVLRRVSPAGDACLIEATVAGRVRGIGSATELVGPPEIRIPYSDSRMGASYFDFSAGKPLAQRLVGVCAFYAAFGRPGASVDTWLRSGGLAFTDRAMWGAPRERWTLRPDQRYLGGSWDMSAELARLGMSPTAAQCIDGSTDACATAVITPGRTKVWYSSSGLGPMSEVFLSDLVRTFGVERMGTWWRSDRPLAEGFRAATGRDLGEATHEWMLETYGTGRFGPVLSSGQLMFSAVLIGLGMLIAVAGMNRRQVG